MYPFWTPMAKRWIGALACIFQRRALIPANTRLNCTDTAGRSCCNSSYNGALKPDRHSACVWPNLENLRAALFLNDKLDLAQAEAVADLNEAHTSAAARSAQRSLEGEFSRAVCALIERMTSLRALVEATLDFP